MRILTFSAALTLVLAGCGGSDFIPLGLPGEVEDTEVTESRAAELQVGMTLQEVARIIGPAIASIDDPHTPGRVCFSHRYGSQSAPLVIHTVFLGGHLQSFSDGHAATCRLDDI